MFALEGPVAAVAPQMGVALLMLSPGLGPMSAFHFFTTGYGSSVAAIAAYNVLKSGAIIGKPIGGLVQNSLLAIFGIRLAAFLAMRSQTDSYKKRPETAQHKGKMDSMPLSGRASIWLSVSLFYVMMAFPACATMATGVDFSNKLFTTGIAVMSAGALLEGVADHQKQVLKKADASAFASTGVFRICRHPAYLGEIMFWVGNYIAGLPSMGTDWRQQLVALPGLLGIVMLMTGASKRLAKKQDEKYAKKKEWAKYKSEVKGSLLGSSW